MIYLRQHLELICALCSAPGVWAWGLLFCWSYSRTRGSDCSEFNVLFWFEQRLVASWNDGDGVNWWWTAVNGCPYRDREDAGNLELDWLEVQLKMYRDRNMQVGVLKLDWTCGIKFGRCISRVGVTLECRSIKTRVLTDEVGHVPPSPGMYFPECVSSS